jgi:hypothetical protein
MEEKIEIIEIWQPSENDGEAIIFQRGKGPQSGRGLKRIALISNNIPIWLAENYVIQKSYCSKEEFDNLNKIKN